MKKVPRGASSAERRAHIEATLHDYPHVDADALADLIRWLRKEASALDVGMIASDPRLNAPYQRFKADHLDRYSGADLFWAAVFGMTAVVSIGAMIWFGL